MLFLILLCTTCAERRLSELDFNSAQVVRIESDDPDGDEIYNRLVFFDSVEVPQAPTTWDRCDVALVQPLARAHSRLVRHLSEPRAPPPTLRSSIA
jgi:hypothetical protein